MNFIKSLVEDKTTSRIIFRLLVFIIMLPLLVVAGALVLLWFATGQIVITLLALGDFAITGKEDFQWFWNWVD